MPVRTRPFVRFQRLQALLFDQRTLAFLASTAGASVVVLILWHSGRASAGTAPSRGFKTSARARRGDDRAAAMAPQPFSPFGGERKLIVSYFRAGCGPPAGWASALPSEHAKNSPSADRFLLPAGAAAAASSVVGLGHCSHSLYVTAV